ncbi:phosphatidylinositol-specific phospholipase C/glycerophosphodiester phosphodiesterase family protein [Paenibacillus pini]|uniref:Glycerophosphoryl diester phosphodiesterase n=1 Tax=Paenibacillus pini JCM 16418 TaxID=1236976 RepID=W7YT14_9BACL|nr:phosphatidylinositol-specific phospholipase C/glycerophosphodiester phosphodiesterase family protein [Paenibacillus pini]GAF10333.1 glycerophosphoryl diester phosphodiesterase [Paenibacillus pini JCM 16418]
MRRKMIALVLLLGTASCLLLFGTKGSSEDKKSNFTDYQVISHAMGGIREQAYTNSYEAFIANYEKGNRVFEVDLLLTSDEKLVARHEWTKSMTEQLGQQDELPEERQAMQLSYSEFKQSKILGSYDPLDWEDILDLLQDYPDMYIVTDTKDENMKLILSKLVNAVQNRDPALMNQIVLQIYDQPMLQTVHEIYPFKQIIYTLYATKDTDAEVVDFVKANSIPVVTIPEQRVTQSFISDLNKAGVTTYVNTINDENEVSKYRRMGVNGVYSDFLTEEEVKSPSWTTRLGL